MTSERCVSSRSFQGTSSGRPRLAQNFCRTPRSQVVLGPLHGLIAPDLSDLRGSGTTLSQSMAITRPKPRQASQAPTGELYEKRPALGASKLRAQRGQARPRVTVRWV